MTISNSFFAPLNSELLPSLQQIETASQFQIPQIQIVGLPSQEVNEARERIRFALLAQGFSIPNRKIILNLFPAHIRKTGTCTDLAMALSILNHTQTLSCPDIPNAKILASGELGLQGEIRSVGQAFRSIYVGLLHKMDIIILSIDDQDRAFQAIELLKSLCKNFVFPKFIFAQTLKRAWEDLQQPLRELEMKASDQPARPATQMRIDETLRYSPIQIRSLSLALAGNHHLLFLGEKGSGKTKALDVFCDLYAGINNRARIEQLLFQELQNPFATLCGTSPIRRPSSHIRSYSLIGNRTSKGVRPGEFSLAHGGVLAADEFPEWHRDSRESFREPLETKTVTLNQAYEHSVLPADFCFIGTGNLCPCGEISPRCQCTHYQQNQYRNRISGPLLDRLDLVVLLQKSDWDKETAPIDQGQITRIKEARKSLLDNPIPSDLEHWANRETNLKKLAFWPQVASLRSRHKILKLSWTIARLSNYESPTSEHLWESYMFRPERVLPNLTPHGM